MNECPGPESRGGRAGGYERPVGQVHGSVHLTNVINRVDRIRRTDGEPIDHHSMERGSARLSIHETVVVSYVRGGRVTDTVGDEDETELVAWVKPRRGLENDPGLGSTSKPGAPTRAQQRRPRTGEDVDPSEDSSTSTWTWMNEDRPD